MGDSGMTKAEALYRFFNSFGIDGFESYSVPEEAPFPRITYDLVTGDYGDTNNVGVNLWYQASSLVEINAMADRIASVIGLGGVQLPCDGGYIHLYRGSPYAQSLDDPDDDTIKRKYINIVARFNTVPMEGV